MKYIAKPALFNNKGMKEFDNAKDAIVYLNEQLSDNDVDQKYDYVFIAPKVSDKQLKKSIEEYVGIKKLFLVD